jgi:hypothetical protein
MMARRILSWLVSLMAFIFFPKRKSIFKKENQGALNLAIFSRG